MGHIRLGTIPKSQPWRQVVSAVIANLAAGVNHSLGGTADSFGPADNTRDTTANSPAEARSVALIASKTLEAAKGGLRDAGNDAGLRFTFYLLSQVAVASRSEAWVALLRDKGVSVRATDSLVELASAFTNAVDDRLERTSYSSDLAEMAQRAAGEALFRTAADRAQTLFGNTGEELRHAIRSLSTPAGFGALSQQFFGSFLTRFLNFYLSRITAAEVGHGSLRDLGDITRFNKQLALHCEQSAAIVRDFASEWYSKTEYQYGIDLRRAGAFVSVAMLKLEAELHAQQSER